MSSVFVFLCSSVISETKHVIKKLTTHVTITLEVLITKSIKKYIAVSLKAYFDPEKPRRYEVYRFQKTVQEPNETLDQFHTRLRTLSETCEFADLEIEQQSIVGETSTKIRKRALRNPTFDPKSMLIEGRRDEQSIAKQTESEKPSGKTKK